MAGILALWRLELQVVAQYFPCLFYYIIRVVMCFPLGSGIASHIGIIRKDHASVLIYAVMDFVPMYYYITISDLSSLAFCKKNERHDDS